MLFRSQRSHCVFPQAQQGQTSPTRRGSRVRCQKGSEQPLLTRHRVLTPTAFWRRGLTNPPLLQSLGDSMLPTLDLSTERTVRKPDRAGTAPSCLRQTQPFQSVSPHILQKGDLHGVQRESTCQGLQQHRRGKQVVAQKAETPRKPGAFQDPNSPCTHFVRVLPSCSSTHSAAGWHCLLPPSHIMVLLPSRKMNQFSWLIRRPLFTSFALSLSLPLDQPDEPTHAAATSRDAGQRGKGTAGVSH